MAHEKYRNLHYLQHQILIYRQRKWSYKAIAKELNLSTKAVQYLEKQGQKKLKWLIDKYT